MATRTNKVEVEITATDEATPKIERLEKKIDGLESDEARITVTAQTDRLEKQLDTAKQKLEGLDGDEASVQLRAIGTLEAELDQAETLLRQLDGKTGTVHITARDTATADIRDVRQELARLDGDTADVGTGRLSGRGIGIGAGVAGLVAGLAAVTDAAADTAIQVQAISNRTGASLEDVSRLVAVFQDAGIEAGDIVDLLLQVNDALAQNPELAEQLGVKIGENTDLVDIFLQTVKGLETGFDNVNESAAAASTVLGEEGVKQVDLVIASVDDLQTAIENVPSTRIYDADDVETGREINAELAEAKGHMQEIGILLLPAVSAALEGLAAYFNAVAAAGDATFDFFDRHPRLKTALFSTDVSDVASAVLGGQNTSSGPVPGGIRGQGATVTVINPPGSPTTTVDAARIYDRRNGAR